MIHPLGYWWRRRAARGQEERRRERREAERRKAAAIEKTMVAVVFFNDQRRDRCVRALAMREEAGMRLSHIGGYMRDPQGKPMSAYQVAELLAWGREQRKRGLL